MASTNGRAFNEWLRAQLKAKKMSQRQLAQQSGVDHSTISRLVRGDRMPSLGTATKLARGLRELAEGDEGPQYLGLLGGATQNPTARVEYSLRADDALSEPQVRQVMEYYLAVRMRRLARTYGTEPSQLRRVEPAPVVRANGTSPYPGQAVAAGGGSVAMATRPLLRRSS
jgi:transcriptional regulator with XRE-family HTH domain